MVAVLTALRGELGHPGRSLRTSTSGTSGNAAGVYDAFCTSVTEEPSGRIVEIDRPRDVIVIDATYEYLPDGLKFTDSSSPITFADCHDYDLKPVEPAPIPTPAPSAESPPRRRPNPRRPDSEPGGR